MTNKADIPAWIFGEIEKKKKWVLYECHRNFIFIPTATFILLLFCTSHFLRFSFGFWVLSSEPLSLAWPPLGIHGECRWTFSFFMVVAELSLIFELLSFRAWLFLCINAVTVEIILMHAFISNLYFCGAFMSFCTY